MASRYELEVKLTSAQHLENVNWRHGPNRPYAVVWVDPSRKCSTRVDESGDTEANWDQTLLIPLPLEPIQDRTLHVDVVHAGSEEDTKPLIGSARLKLADVLNDVGMGGHFTKSLTLKLPSGMPQGKVEVTVTIRETGYRAPAAYYAPPYAVRPPYAHGNSYSAPPTRVQVSYHSSAPPAQGSYYSAPPAQGSYYSAQPPSGYPYEGCSGYNAPPQTASYGQGWHGHGAPAAEDDGGCDGYDFVEW